jgi:hypothetical protein
MSKITKNKEKIIDLLLKLYYNDNNLEYKNFLPGDKNGEKCIEYLKINTEFNDVCENLGLPNTLPKPKYPKAVWAAFKFENTKPGSSLLKNTVEVFAGSMEEVTKWAENNPKTFNFVGPTSRTDMTDEEAYMMWRNGILNHINENHR